MDPADVPLNDDEQRFVDEWIIDRKSTMAYRRSFPGVSYATARRAGREMRLRPNVDREISAALHAQRIRTQVTADAVQEEIANIAFFDIYDLYDPDTGTLRNPRAIPYMTRKAIASIRVSRQSSTRHVRRKRRTTVKECIVEYKFWNKMDALGKLCLQLGMQTEITPLDALLRALPTDLAIAVRNVLVTPERVTAPSSNGNGKH